MGCEVGRLVGLKVGSNVGNVAGFLVGSKVGDFVDPLNLASVGVLFGREAGSISDLLSSSLFCSCEPVANAIILTKTDKSSKLRIL